MKSRSFLIWLAPLGFIAVAAALAAVIMVLWNSLMPAIFGLTAISYWQALGLLVLARLLFGNFGGYRRHWHGNGRNHIRERWDKMTPEQKEEFMKNRFHHHHFWGEAYKSKDSSAQNEQ